jgi:hypothetical protein
MHECTHIHSARLARLEAVLLMAVVVQGLHCDLRLISTLHLSLVLKCFGTASTALPTALLSFHPQEPCQVCIPYMTWFGAFGWERHMQTFNFKESLSTFPPTTHLSTGFGGILTRKANVDWQLQCSACFDI